MSDAEEISRELDLEYVLEREGVSFKKSRGVSGWQLNICECPCCGDRRYRVYLNAEHGAGNCFVCNENFSKLSFVHKALGHRNYADTFRYAREVLVEQGWRPRRVTPMAVNIETVKLPESFALPTPEGENLLYLESRGVDSFLAGYFHLRYCIEGWWNFTKDDGSRGGQKFDGRVIVPVFDLDGSLVTFQGRDISGLSDRKYLFPSGLPGTGRFLFNAQNAVKTRRVVMGEGAFDVIALKRAIDAEVSLRDYVPVGSFGKHLSYGNEDGNDQLGRFIQLRRNGLEEVVIMWDGEHAALISALDAAKLLVRIGLKVRIATLPHDKDPNEVPAQVVCEALIGAKPYDARLDMRWRLSSPY